MEEETEASQPDGGAEESPKKKSLLKRILKKKVVLILLLVVLMAGAGGGAAWFFFLKPSPEEEPPMEAQPAVITEDQIQAAIDKKDDVIFEGIITLMPFEQIKMKGTSVMGRISFDIALELLNPEDRKLFYPMEERVRKVVESQAMESTWMELRNPEGKIKLKYELLKRVNGLFNKPIIRNIYFTKFIMQ